jgi:hypothetical protein
MAQRRRLLAGDSETPPQRVTVGDTRRGSDALRQERFELSTFGP